MIDVVSLGEALIDMFPAEIGRSLVEVTAFRPVPGGAPANLAIAAARLGARSAFIGKVGDDPFGHYLAELLQRQGVETRGMRFDSEARTGINFHAQIDENNATHLYYRHPSADMRLRPDELERSLLQEARAFAFGTICLIDQPVHDATMEAIHVARKAGALIAFDVNYRESLWSEPGPARNLVLSLLPLVDVLKINEAELLLLTGSSELAAGTQQLIQHGPALCVVTLGPQGCFYRHADQSGHVPGFTVQAIDATGCGDAFTAALLTQLVTGHEAWRECLIPEQLPPMLRLANAAGALTALNQGAFFAMPDAAAVSAFLEQYDNPPHI
jgi:fructokinase